MCPVALVALDIFWNIIWNVEHRVKRVNLRNPWQRGYRSEHAAPNLEPEGRVAGDATPIVSWLCGTEPRPSILPAPPPPPQA